jgi:uncharacterized protein YjbI with pentapeptide repeats
MYGVSLGKSLASGADFSGATIAQTDFYGVDLRRTKFDHATVTASRFTLAATDDGTFAGAVLTNNFMPNGRLQAQGPSDGK